MFRVGYVGYVAHQAFLDTAAQDPLLEPAKIPLEKLQAGNPCSLWVSAQWNEWQGSRRLQLQVRHAEMG